MTNLQDRHHAGGYIGHPEVRMKNVIELIQSLGITLQSVNKTHI